MQNPSLWHGQQGKSSGREGLFLLGESGIARKAIFLTGKHKISFYCPSSKEQRVGARSRKMTDKFCFDGGHTLFSDNTRRSEENTKKKIQNSEKQRKFQMKVKKKKNEIELAQLRALVKKQKNKIAALTKKIARKK